MGNNEVTSKIVLIRMLRLVRLARMVRLMVQFRTLWILVQGLFHSLGTLIWTLTIIIVLMYIFSVLGVELIRPDGHASEEYVQASKKFDDLFIAMFTLLEILALDGLGDVVTPLCVEKWYLMFYFASYIMISSIALMNLVTAVMVESSMQQAAADKEGKLAWESARKKSLIPGLRKMFKELDPDGSGDISLREILAAPPEMKEALQQISNMDDVVELFHVLDYDGSGALEVDEFCDGLLKAQNEHRPMELLRIMQQNKEMSVEINELREDSAAQKKATLAVTEHVRRLSDQVSKTVSNMDGRIAAVEHHLARIADAVCPAVGVSANMKS